MLPKSVADIKASSNITDIKVAEILWQILHSSTYTILHKA